jgi:hypothetical protein
MKIPYSLVICCILLYPLAACDTQPLSPKGQARNDTSRESSASRDEPTKVHPQTDDKAPAAQRKVVPRELQKSEQSQPREEDQVVTKRDVVSDVVARLQAVLEAARQELNDMLLFIGMRIYYSTIQNPGRFDRARCEAIVAEVRARGLKPGQSADLRLDDISSPKSLRPRKADEWPKRGENAGSVWATVTADGKLKVVIETRDLGHAGEFGFAYSEKPLSPEKPDNDHDSPRLSLPGPLNTPLRKIDARWWSVHWSELD